MMLKKQLAHVGILHAVNAQQALDYLDERISQPETLPKLIRQNLYLPSLRDGLDLLQGIRTKLAAYSAQQLPILVMSLSDMSDHIRRAYQAGASSFMISPAICGSGTCISSGYASSGWNSSRLSTAIFLRAGSFSQPIRQLVKSVSPIK